MPNPLLNASAFMSLEDVRRALGQGGKPVHHYKAKAWLAEHALTPVELSAQFIAYDRAAVERAITGEAAPVPVSADPAFDPNQFVNLAAAARLLGAGGKRPFDTRRTRRWLISAGVPIFRPFAKVALVPKAELQRAMVAHTERRARPARRNRRHPPYIRSIAQATTQEKATQAATARREAIAAGKPPPPRAPKLTGNAALARKGVLKDWARDDAPRGKPLPNIEHRTPAPSEVAAPRPQLQQPVSRKYGPL